MFDNSLCSTSIGMFLPVRFEVAPGDAGRRTRKPTVVAREVPGEVLHSVPGTLRRFVVKLERSCRSSDGLFMSDPCDPWHPWPCIFPRLNRLSNLPHHQSDVTCNVISWLSRKTVPAVSCAMAEAGSSIARHHVCASLHILHAKRLRAVRVLRTVGFKTRLRTPLCFLEFCG